jgi:hypothetical protein
MLAILPSPFELPESRYSVDLQYLEAYASTAMRLLFVCLTFAYACNLKKIALKR